MKKIKVLTSLVGLSGLTVGLIPTIAGCSTSKDIVTFISNIKDREFDENTNALSFAFEATDINEVSNIKVKVVNMVVDGAEAKSVAGLIKTTYDSAGHIKVRMDTNVILSHWASGQNISFDLQFTNKVNGNSTTLTGFTLARCGSGSSEKPASTELVFETCSWDKLSAVCDLYYAKTISDAEFFAYFNDEYGNAITSFDDFIGLVKEVTINSLTHKIVVIGCNHDTIHGTSDKALFTFQSQTCLSNKNDGQSELNCLYDENNNKNYLTSQLRTNLNSTDTGKGVWNQTSLTKSVIQMLPTELSACIKTVDKKVATYQTSAFVLTDYYDKLFPLTLTEFDYDFEVGTTLPGEGTKYQYWSEAKSDGTFVQKMNKKFDAYNNGCYSWIASPVISDNNFERVWGCYSSAYDIDTSFNYYFWCNLSGTVDFAFCI